MCITDVQAYDGNNVGVNKLALRLLEQDISVVAGVNATPPFSAEVCPNEVGDIEISIASFAN